MKAIFQVSGVVKFAGKVVTHPSAPVEIELNANSVNGAVVSQILLTPHFPPKESLLIDRYEKSIRLEGEIEAKKSFFHLLAILNNKGFTRLDLSKCKAADDNIAEALLQQLLQAVKTNFEVQEIVLPEGISFKDEQQSEFEQCLLRNKALQKLTPWYANPLKNASAAKLVVSFVAIALVGSLIGFSLSTLFILSTLYALTGAVFGNWKEKNLQNAWLKEKYMPENNTQSLKGISELGYESRKDWGSFGKTFYPNKDNFAAIQHYDTYLVGALRAEMDRPELPSERVDMEERSSASGSPRKAT